MLGVKLLAMTRLCTALLAIGLMLLAPRAWAQGTSARPATAGAQRATRAAQAVARVLASVDRDLARGAAPRAERRLLAALMQQPRSTLLLARYAELALPLSAEASPAPRPESARTLLARLQNRDALPGDADALPEPERERVLLLHAALAQAVLARYDDALALATAAGRLQDLGTVSCLRRVGAIAASRDQLDSAERALSLARQFYLQDLALATELGHVLLARGQGEAALRLFAERHAIQPDALAARRDFAYALASQGRAGEALGLLVAARAGCEADSDCTLEAARIALEAGRPVDAITWAQRRLALRGEDLDALFVLGDAHTRTGALHEARNAYERVRAVRPDSVRARQALEQLPTSTTPAR